MWYPGCKARISQTTPRQRWNKLFERMSSYKHSDLQMDTTMEHPQDFEGQIKGRSSVHSRHNLDTYIIGELICVLNIGSANNVKKEQGNVKLM